MENVIEIWKPVVGLEDYYMVSSLGRVKSLERVVKFGRGHRVIKEKILSIFIGTGGYQIVNLNNKTQSLHRIIAEAFIPNPENKKEVDHINGDKTDNRVENLRWATRTENQNNPITKERQRKSKFGNCNNKKPIIQFTLNGRFLKKWDSARDASDELNIWYTDISNCLRNRYKTAGGYIWKYYDLETYLIGIMNNNIKKGAA